MLATETNDDMITIQAPEDVTLLLNALSVISWSNTFGTPVLEGAAMKVVSPSALRKSPHFRSNTLAEFNGLLAKLAQVGIISEMMPQVTGGRPTNIFLLDQAFTPQNRWKLNEAEINKSVAGRLTHFFSTSPIRSQFAKSNRSAAVVEAVVIDDLQPERESPTQDLPIPTRLKATNDFTFTSNDGLFRCFKKGQVIDDKALVKEVLALALPATVAEEETTPQPITLKALHNFTYSSQRIGFLLSFKQGQLITDLLIVRELLELDMPVINSEEEISTSHFYCDKCNRLHEKLAEPAHGAKYALRPKSHFFAMFQGLLMEYDSSKIITDPIVIRFFNEHSEYYPTKVVYQDVDYARCECGNLFYFNKEVRQEE